MGWCWNELDVTVNKMMNFDPAENDYENPELVPPPLFTKQEMPFDYRYEIVPKWSVCERHAHNFFTLSYQQNPAVVRVKVRQPDGSVCITYTVVSKPLDIYLYIWHNPIQVAIKLVNRYKQRKDIHFVVPWEATVIPDKPPNSFRPLEGEALQTLNRVKEVRTINVIHLLWGIFRANVVVLSALPRTPDMDEICNQSYATAFHS